jgi:hypothetical protein
MSADATYLLRHVYRWQLAAGEISESVAENLLSIAHNVADKSDDFNPSRYASNGCHF